MTTDTSALVEERPRVRDTWGICPACGRERRTTAGAMAGHGVWIPSRFEMVPCPGAGRAPSRATT